MVNIHVKSASKNSKIFTAFISSAVEVFPSLYFGRGVVLNAKFPKIFDFGNFDLGIFDFGMKYS